MFIVVINILGHFVYKCNFFCKKISAEVYPPTDIIEPEKMQLCLTSGIANAASVKKQKRPEKNTTAL